MRSDRRAGRRWDGSREVAGPHSRKRTRLTLVVMLVAASLVPVLVPPQPASAHAACTTPVSATVRGKVVDFDQCYDSSFSFDSTTYRVHVYYTEQNTAANQGRCTAAEGAARCEHAISVNDDVNGDNVNAVATAQEAAAALQFYFARNLSPLPAGGTEMNIYVAEDPRGGGVIYPNSLYWDDEWVDSNDILFKRLLAYHEEMHLVEDKFDNGGIGWAGWYGEGIARAIEDRAVATLDTDLGHLFIPEVNGHLASNAERIADFLTLDYRTVLWWTWMMDRYRAGGDTNPVIGWAALRDFFVELNTETTQLKAVQDFLVSKGSSWDRDFVDYALALYAYKYNPTDERLGFLDTEITGAATGGLQGHGPISGGPAFATVNPSMNPRSSRYYEFNPASQCDFTSFTFDGGTKPYAYSVMTVDDGDLQTRATSRGTSWARTVRTSGLDRIVGVVTSVDQTGPVAVGRGCVTPTVDIKRPTTAAVANVGREDNPRKFIVRLSVRDGSSPVAGLKKEDFTAQLRLTPGGSFFNADILSAAYVQDDYWLMVQAPNVGGGGANGEFFDLRVLLGTQSDTEPSSVLYVERTLDSVVVLDRSGSMSDFNKIKAARNAAKLFINELSEDDQGGYVAFDHNPYLRHQLARIGDGTNRADIKADIAGEIPGGATSIGDGMRVAATKEDARGIAGNVCSLILLSDGHENSDDLWSAVRPNVIDNGCQMHVVALGAGANEVLMQQIASSVPGAGGSYDYADVATGVPVSSAAPASVPSGGSILNWENNLARVYDYKAAQAAGRQRIYSAVGRSAKGRVGGVAHFDDLSASADYSVGDSFSSGGADGTGDTFFRGDGSPTDDGVAMVDGQGQAGGSGQDMRLDNINVIFDLPGTPPAATFLFGEYGGNVNLAVNGDLENATDLLDLHGESIGGVEVSVTDLDKGLGLVSLKGNISSLEIGGQELWIDDIVYGQDAHEFYVDDTSDVLVVSTSWQTGDSSHDVRLIDPTGAPVSTSLRRAGAGNTNEVWEVPAPAEGTWRLEVDGIDQQYYVGASARSHYELHVFAGTPVRSLREGVDVPLIAMLAGDGEPVDGAAVRATVTDPAGNRRTVRLYDNGNHNDGDSGDGVYGGVYQGTSQGDVPSNPDTVVDGAEPDVQGSYQVLAKATFKEIVREAQTSFALASAKDADKDGIADDWERSNGLNPKTKGDGSDDDDHDRILNFCEFKLGTDPRNTDSDGGGQADGSEVDFNKEQRCPSDRLDPTDPDDDKIRPMSFVLTSAEANRKGDPFLETILGDPFRGKLVSVDIFRKSWTRSGKVSESRAKVANDFGKGKFVDDEVRNGYSYRYEVVPQLLKPGRVDNFGTEGTAALRGGTLFTEQTTAKRDPYAPGGTILINGGDETTSSELVTLNLSADDVGPESDGDPLANRIGSDAPDLEMRLSNSPKFPDAKWEPFRRTVKGWNLDNKLGDGDTAVVYLQLRDEAGNVSRSGFGQVSSIVFVGGR